MIISKRLTPVSSVTPPLIPCIMLGGLNELTMFAVCGSLLYESNLQVKWLEKTLGNQIWCICNWPLDGRKNQIS